MKIKYFLMNSPHAELSFTLNEKQNRCEIGRSGSGIQFRDRYCSRIHALIYGTPGEQLKIRDLESRNGTFVNGRRIKDVALTVGDTIRIGQQELLITAIELADSSISLLDGVVVMHGWIPAESIRR